MNRMLAIVERELRKFFRSPALMLVAMVFPLVQLVILGNAFGGKVRNTTLAVVDQDRGPEALKVIEMLRAVHANANTFAPVMYDNQQQAVEDVRNGKVQGAIVIPPEFSRKYYEKTRPQIGLVVDNTDTFVSAAFEDSLSGLVQALNMPDVQPTLVQQVALSVVELYPYIEYMKYLLPGSIVLAMFVSVMIGGGIVYIDDKARGIHEGYLVTPITKLELVLGLNLAGALKAMGAGVVITVIGSLLSGMGTIFHPVRMLWLLLMIVLTSTAFICMMSMIMARVDDPLVPRAIFGILNTLLFFPSGAIYPVSAFPAWLRVIANIDPFTYAVHGFKAILLKEVGIAAIWPDLLYLTLFTMVTLTGTTLLFKRTL